MTEKLAPLFPREMSVTFIVCQMFLIQNFEVNWMQIFRETKTLTDPGTDPLWRVSHRQNATQTHLLCKLTVSKPFTQCCIWVTEPLVCQLSNPQVEAQGSKQSIHVMKAMKSCITVNNLSVNLDWLWRHFWMCRKHIIYEITIIPGLLGSPEY